MFRRTLILFALILGALALTSCHRSRVQNPLAGLDSKQPDKVLFDRAMEAMKKGKYEVSRTVLQTLINTYPDSEYIARAKLAVGDAWYAEAGTSGLAQAEIEYKDFITFFPNVPEAAEAQLKVANIHYRQMEKPDRDFTHARRAEEEYRNLILQFPDSKLVPEAKQRLRQVQEVLAEREYRIGRFYYLRQSWPAAIARLKTLTDSYPLYSQADEALYMLGSAFEGQIDLTRRAKGVKEVDKARVIEDFTNKAADAYSHLVNRYPLMERSADASKRLAALGRPVPKPSAQAIAQNRAEQESRSETGKMGAIMGNFRRAPDVSRTAKVGEPNLTGTKDASAPEFLRQVQATMLGKPAGQESGTVSVETVGKGAPPSSQSVPRSEQTETQEQQSAPARSEQVGSQEQQQQPAETGIPEIKPLESNPSQTPPPASEPKPLPQADSSEAPANDPAPPPAQVNEAQRPASAGEAAPSDGDTADKQAEDQDSADGNSDTGNSSSSKKKKKKAPPKSP
ncbi:MAG: outer membrane protein assembly factor BamD [Acidobacteriales bacterium]|nr:outer membrane protein assembly factor BamD [Terriglobales bacterium]